ncbi:sigma 54-interacting transcriptional regulator [Thermovorax subterraneus]|nr:sigma 54-interacting transcriptional regulator [Thermovorax subterraneus]
MRNEENAILLIAPHKKLKIIAEDVIREHKFNVKVVEGNLLEGVKLAKYYEENGTEVIISRGGTYKLIKDSVSIPVVEIQVSAYDILRALKKYFKSRHPIGVIGYENVIFGIDTLADVLGLDLISVVVRDEKAAYKQILEITSQGVRNFIGDTIGIELVAQMGFNGSLIESGKEAIFSSINEARRVLNIRRKERERAERFRVIMDFIRDGIVAVDENGNITIYNNSAREIFKKEESEVKKDHLDFIKFTKIKEVLETGEMQIGELQRINDDTIVVANRVPIIVDGKIKGVVATYQDVTQIQKMEQKIRKELQQKGLQAKYHFEDIVHRSKVMEDTIKRAKKYAKIDSTTVLILGESGTGKELFAHSIHNESPRAKGPFVAINCAALPESLLESELFGYAEGAFTGAKRGGKMGLFEMAHRGTIFLDEIGDMPLNLQARLLRVIQEKEVMRLGDDRIIPVDVRIIASTNRNLEEAVEKGLFRSDLYYRLNILRLEIPPLRERKEDIPLLVDIYIKKYAKSMRKCVKGITVEALEYLKGLDYPGNVRELRGIIERAVAITDSEYIDIDDIKVSDNKAQAKHAEVSGDLFNVGSLKELEEYAIKKALEAAGNNITKAAKILGVDRTTIWRKVKKMSLKRDV